MLDFLREQFALVHARLDVLQGDIIEVKVLMSAVEAGMGHLRIELAGMNTRLDRMDARIDRIERRLAFG